MSLPGQSLLHAYSIASLVPDLPLQLLCNHKRCFFHSNCCGEKRCKGRPVYEATIIYTSSKKGRLSLETKIMLIHHTQAY